MIVSLRRHYADLITSGGQLILLIIALDNPEPEIVLPCLGLMALLSVFAWASATRRHRAIADTPTSKVSSAAQGYAELQGRGLAFSGTPVLSPLTHLPCLWYRYRTERRDSNNKWQYEESGESDASFILDDGSGQCLIDPEGAEMLVTRHDSWTSGDLRYNQWLLLERDSLYALGQFVTKDSVDLELSIEDGMKRLLDEWKKNRQTLLHRFDTNRDGEIDLKEWETARRQAKREVVAAHRETRNQAEVHIMRYPDDGRMYLISDLDPNKLALRYRLWSWFHLIVFFGALAGVAYVLKL